MKTTELVIIKYWKREAYCLVCVRFTLELEFCSDEFVILRPTNELAAVGVMVEGLGTTCVMFVLLPEIEQATP